MVYVFITQALKELSAFTVNLSLNLEPIYSIFLSFIFFKEYKEVNFSFYIGLSFVILSIISQTFISFKKMK